MSRELELAKLRTLEWAREVYATHGHDPVRCDVVAHQESKTLAERTAPSDRPKLGVWAWLSLAWTIYRVATLLWQLWRRDPQPSDKQVATILGLLDRHYQEQPEGVAEE